ncbi:DUF3566 domain-containing protein [uncultured Pseudokineococcus sp.]|uniref:DUF3566 domain-containing protein n=1 Tax=uncultured Pseudokineococcus sp. TaxID=1642928 RepID=UPI00263424BB|nr:DUF3566 domain-containing protein [uncultured Pseudokineococcus sp.]
MSASEARTQQSTAGGTRSASERAPRAGQQPRDGQDPQQRTSSSAAGQRDGQGPVGAAGRAAPAGSTQRRVRLSVSRVDPWSALKLSFLLSVVVGIALVVAAGALWTVLDAVGVYDSVNQLIADFGGPDTADVTDFVAFSQVVSAATVLAVVDVVLLTALATLGAIVYNVAAALVGGLRVTLTDD